MMDVYLVFGEGDRIQTETPRKHDLLGVFSSETAARDFVYQQNYSYDKKFLLASDPAKQNTYIMCAPDHHLLDSLRILGRVYIVGAEVKGSPLIALAEQAK